jgi:hypothetical protein
VPFLRNFHCGGKTGKKAERKIRAVEVWRTRESEERFCKTLIYYFSYNFLQTITSTLFSYNLTAIASGVAKP